jgi:N-acetylglucosamine-6-phosphate deacetylase
LHEAVANVVNYAGVTLDEAIEMASANPAALLGLEESYGRIAPGRPAHLVLFRWDDEAKRIEIMATVIDGQIIYQKEGNDERT